MPLILVLLLVLMVLAQCKAQTNIGGVVNVYTPVTAIVNCVCPETGCNLVTVTSSAGFAVGDKVIIMQMKGAQVDSTNTSAHGSILNLYDAGNYEYATIANIAANVITTSYPLKETYGSGPWPDSTYIQMIKVAVYSGNVNVTSALRPQAWSAATRTGGVLAIEVSGILTLQANITADTLGFRGAMRAVFAVSCGYDTAFYYQSTIAHHPSCTGCGYAYADSRQSTIASYGGCAAPCNTSRMDSEDPRVAAYRGEGISANTFKKTFSSGSIPVAPFIKGKGRWGNGGGGGSNHNGGGGGGGNYGAGGFGGKMYNTTGTGCPATSFSSRRGYGGADLTPTGTKLFMGGGGGEGHDNAGQGSTGTAGGGIILITAASFASSGAYTISANAKDNTFAATSDGSGGGGAGGTILLEIPGAFANAVTISAKGGKGGDNSQANCHGPGGGGGGGVIWFSQSSLPANVTTNVVGGAYGTNTHAGADCASERNWGAVAGSDGIVLYGNASGASTFLNINTCSTPLPVQLVSFRATPEEKEVQLTWITASEVDNDYFMVEKSTDGKSFSELTRVKGAGNSTEVLHYSTTDNYPHGGKNYYRLSQVDYNGTVSRSQTVEVGFKMKDPEIKIFPNPAQAQFTVSVSDQYAFDLVITDMNGRVFASFDNQLNKTEVNSADFQNGVYFLKIMSLNAVYYKKVIIKN